MNPKCLPKGALEASKRPLDAEIDFRVLFGAILDPPIIKIGAEIGPKTERRFEAIFLAIWRPLGVVWGSILGSFWAPFWAPGRVIPF